MINNRTTIQEIYCDESGFTGGNLLDAASPFFTYATVAVSQDEAKEFVDKVIKDYKVQSTELKFNKLIKYSRGKQAITYILKTFHEQTKVVVHHKKYSLACKFYEYVFEPTIASNNSLFYNLGFHKFISNFLYLEFQQETKYAEEIFTDFYTLMKSKDYEETKYMFSALVLPDISPMLDLIKTFCIYHRNTINEELDSLKGKGVGKWILDLTGVSLASLLAEWGQKYQQLQVFCDESKPLQEQPEVFNAMINRQDKIFIEVEGKEHPISFNLATQLEFVNSKTYPGIQIADVAAGTFAFVFQKNLKEKDAEYPDEWKEYLVKSISGYSVLPNLTYLDVNQIAVKRNFLLLEELVERSVNKVPLLEGIAEFVSKITGYLYFNQTL